jgi:hypothetical protein
VRRSRAEHVAGASAPRARRDVDEIVARLPLGVGKGEHEIAASDLLAE